MKTRLAVRISCTVLAVLLAAAPTLVQADIDNAGIADKVLSRYSTAAGAWGTIITSYASWLFWTLTLISMVWTFGMMALRKADIGEFFAEFIRFTVFTGFFWWLLVNGPAFATSIIDSMRQVGTAATGRPSDLSPSGVMDIGFAILFRTIDKSSISSPMDSAIGILIALVILVVLTLVAVNMLLLLISGWILAYAGSFFLGFGGSRWTSDMAINYFKTCLGLGTQVFAMVLLVGIAQSFIDEYFKAMAEKFILQELAVILVVAIVLLALVRSVPPLVGSLAGGAGGMGSGFGVGAVVGAAGMGAAAMASAGAAVGAGAVGMAGGAQALMAAFSKASESTNAGAGGASALLGAAGTGEFGGNSSVAGGSALASAMGVDLGGSSDATVDQGFGGSANSGGLSESDGDEQAARYDSAGTADTEGNGSTSNAGTRDASASPQSNSAASENGENHGFGAQSTGEQEASGGKAIAGGAMATARAAASKAGKIAVGTVANLAQGTWDVARGKVGDLTDAAQGRIGETTGGQIAAAISARGSGGTNGLFGADSLSAGSSEELDAGAEIAAFRDGTPKAS